MDARAFPAGDDAIELGAILDPLYAGLPTLQIGRFVRIDLALCDALMDASSLIGLPRIDPGSHRLSISQG